MSEDEVFLIQFPIWMLAHPTALSKGLIKVGGKDGEQGFPLFTDEDLANRFRVGPPNMEHYVLGLIENRTALNRVLAIIEDRGFKHVAIDPTNKRVRFAPIGEFRAAVDASGHDQASQEP